MTESVQISLITAFFTAVPIVATSFFNSRVQLKKMDESAQLVSDKLTLEFNALKQQVDRHTRMLAAANLTGARVSEKLDEQTRVAEQVNTVVVEKLEQTAAVVTEVAKKINGDASHPERRE